MWKQQQCRNRPASLSLVASCWASGSFGLAAERVEQAASGSLSHGGREEGRLIKLALFLSSVLAIVFTHRRAFCPPACLGERPERVERRPSRLAEKADRAEWRAANTDGVVHFAGVQRPNPDCCR